MKQVIIGYVIGAIVGVVIGWARTSSAFSDVVTETEKKVMRGEFIHFTDEKYQYHCLPVDRN